MPLITARQVAVTALHGAHEVDAAETSQAHRSRIAAEHLGHAQPSPPNLTGGPTHTQDGLIP